MAVLEVPFGAMGLGTESITVSTSVEVLTPPEGASFAFLVVRTQGVRYTDDGTEPSSSVGAELAAGDVVRAYDLPAVQLIRSGASDGRVDVLYYSGGSR